MIEDALRFAHIAKDIFSVVDDSFGREISVNVIDEIIFSLKGMSAACEDSVRVSQMLLLRIGKSEELGAAAAAIKIDV